MIKQKKTYDTLLYLDPDFISSKYEEIKNISPSVQFSKTEGMKAEGGIPLLKADIHTQETKTFCKSSLQMLNEILDELYKYDEFKITGFDSSNMKTQICWIKGMFTLGAWKSQVDAVEFRVFEVYTKDKPFFGMFSLLVQPENFKANVESILKVDSILTGGIGIKVKALVRILFYQTKIPTYICCPYLLLEQ
jgi:hypothetical protein